MSVSDELNWTAVGFRKKKSKSFIFLIITGSSRYHKERGAIHYTQWWCGNGGTRLICRFAITHMIKVTARLWYLHDMMLNALSVAILKHYIVMMWVSPWGNGGSDGLKKVRARQEKEGWWILSSPVLERWAMTLLKCRSDILNKIYRLIEYFWLISFYGYFVWIVVMATLFEWGEVRRCTNQ